MGKFARIIELPNDEQVLITKGWDDDDGYYVTVQTDVDTMAVTTTLTFKNEKDRDHCFDTYNSAQEFHNSMRKLLLED